MEFKKYSLDQLLIHIVDNRGRTCPTSEQGIPLIATNCIKQDSLFPVFEKIRYISQDTYNNWFRSHPKPNDIIFVCKGSPGRVAWTPEIVNFCIAQDMVALRANPQIIDPKYLFALLRSDEVQQKISNMHVGTLIPHFKKGDFKNLHLDIITDLTIQKKIGNKYFQLLEKIEINTQINQTLEQIAQALFKSWFVDFDPVRAKVQALSDGLSLEQAELAAMQAISGKTPEELTALSQTQPERYAELAETAKAFPCEMVEVDGVKVPKGWEVKPLGDLISFVKGKKPKAVSPNQEENMLPHILTSSLEGKYNEFCESNKLITVEYQNTVMLMDGSNSGRIAIGHNGVIGSTLAKINLDNNKIWAIIYQFLKHKEADIQANTTGTTIPHTDKNRVNNYLMVIPDNFLLEKFTGLFDNSLLKIISNKNQIISLETTRDLLLPRLLSGVI